MVGAAAVLFSYVAMLHEGAEPLDLGAPVEAPAASYMDSLAARELYFECLTAPTHGEVDELQLRDCRRAQRAAEIFAYQAPYLGAEFFRRSLPSMLPALFQALHPKARGSLAYFESVLANMLNAPGCLVVAYLCDAARVYYLSHMVMYCSSGPMVSALQAVFTESSSEQAHADLYARLVS